ncbi:MAG: hypothetical protein QOJ99_3507, partial [Bryobacterales bacterium]|nr:hypothetical protein [Bryobacterales bacterium]
RKRDTDTRELALWTALFAATVGPGQMRHFQSGVREPGSMDHPVER